MCAGAPEDRFADGLDLRTGQRNLEAGGSGKEGKAERERFLRGEAFLGFAGGFLEADA